MHTRLMRSAALTIVLLGLSSGCRSTPTAQSGTAGPATGKNIRVDRAGSRRAAMRHDAGVSIVCTSGNKVIITLEQWNIHGIPDDQIAFRLVGSPGADDYLEITWKRPDDKWPLNASYYKVTRANPVVATVRSDASNGRYAYNVSFLCRSGTSVFTGVIDPDLIISGGTKSDSTQY